MELTDLQETTTLAHLNLSEQELQAFSPALEQMLSLFTVMEAATADSPKVTTHADYVTVLEKTVDADYLRPDTAQNGIQKETNEFMLAQAGERDGSFVVIPNVL